MFFRIKIILIVGASVLLSLFTFLIVNSRMSADEQIVTESNDIVESCTLNQISAGLDHYLALSGDGSIWAWGYNSKGQLGQGNNLSQANLTKIDSVADIKSISAGQNFSLALQDDGTLWGWGDNTNRNIDPEDAFYLRPKKMKVSDVKEIAAGNTFSLILKNDGFVWIVGNYKSGSSDLRQIPNLHRVKAISAKPSPLFLTDDGKVWEWVGENPEEVSGLSDVISIAGTSGGASFAIKSDKTVWGWGQNRYGELANDNKNFMTSVPIEIKDLKNVTKIAAGNYFSTAMINEGEVVIWGDASYKDGNNIIMPTKVDFITQVKDLDAGFSSIVFLGYDNSIWTHSTDQQLPRLVKFPSDTCANMY